MEPNERLDQADLLASLNPSAERPVDLRRAVSAACYAVFHHLVREGVRQRLGPSPRPAATAHVLARAFSHEELRTICGAFGNGVGGWKVWMRDLLGGTDFAVPDELREACREFVQLMQLRHRANYDPSWDPPAPQAQEIVAQARTVIDLFDAAAGSPGHTFFLACLTDWKALRTRGA